MTNESLAYIIGYFNRGNISDGITLKEIGINVILAEIPASFGQRKSTFEKNNLTTLKHFLISNEDKKYVGIVHDMVSDLHWYVTKANRKKGYLTNALKKIILPYLSKSRVYQDLSFVKDFCGEYYESSKKVAKKLGFAHKSTEYIEGKAYERYRKNIAN